MILYKLTNKVNGKAYIGFTTGDIRRRWAGHKCAANKGNSRPLYRAIRKYGADAFEIEIIGSAETLEEIKSKEQDAIIEHNTFYSNNLGYNMTDGGDGGHYVNRAKGENNSNSLMTEAAVIFMRQPEHKDVNNTVMTKMVCDMFGLLVSVDAVKCARNGKTWKHLDQEHPPIKAGKGSRVPVMSEERLSNAKKTLDAHRPAANKKLAEALVGKRAKHAKMDFDQVKDIYYADESLIKTAQRHGISKKMVLLIRHQKSYTYWTKEFSRA